MPGQQLSNALMISVDSTPLPADLEALVVSAYVDDSLNLPDLFVLRFRDPDRLVLAKSKVKVGSQVTVKVLTGEATTPKPLILGEVTALEAEFDSTGTFTVIRGYDHAHRLFRGRRTESYTQVTASDVATKVARRAGLPIGTVEPTSTVFEHVSQAGTTDWQFLDGLAREIGYEAVVRDGKFEFRKPGKASAGPDASGGANDPLVLQLGTDLLRFRAVVTSAEQVKEVTVRGWDVELKKALVGTAPAKTESAALQATSPAALAESFGDRVYVASDVPYRSQAEVDTAAGAIAEQIAGTFAEFEGVARGNPSIRAGAAIAIDNLGAPFDGKYVVTTSRHVYDQSTGYRTHFAVTGRQERSLFGLASGGGPAYRSLSGVVIAQVSDANDPQEMGRVTLTFPWLSDDYVSDWARTVQAGAGKDRGALVVPEVGDEVLVAFEQGDVRRPYVVGGLFNGVDKPKAGPVSVVDGGSGAVNRRSVVSRNGHRIDLLDEDGKTEGVSVTTGNDKLRLVLDATGTVITVHSDGKVLVEAKDGVTVDAGQGKLELKGMDITLTATSGVKLSAGTELAMSGATAKLDGGSMCTVSGGLVKIN